MRPYDPTQPLISLHIPKTAGTSLTAVLREWFPDGRLLLHYMGDGPPERHDLHGPVCVHGHFNGARGFGIWQYYPQATQFIAFLREPFDRFVSHWLFMHRVRRRAGGFPELDGQPAFETWLHARAEEQQAGTNSYSPVWFLPRPPGTIALDRMIDEGFVFLGTVEHLPDSIRALAAVLGRPPVDLPHLNAAPRPDTSYEKWRSFYESRFADEYRLYDAALARLAAFL